MEFDKTHDAWAEKYRPKKIDDCILPEGIKKQFIAYRDSKNTENLIVSGGPGMGKTTVSKALALELGWDCLVINASLEGNIDTVRNKVMDFVTTNSFESDMKCVIFDEADNMSQASQKSLRMFIEQFSRKSRFIFTCNNPALIIDALKSRTTTINFKITAEEKSRLQAAFAKRVIEILKNENVEFEAPALIAVVKKYFPDNRKILNELQSYSRRGKIDSGILSFGASNVDELVGYLKTKDFKKFRQWAVDNLDNDIAITYKSLYDGMYSYVDKDSICNLVLLISNYQNMSANSMNPEITFVAFCVEVSHNLKFN